MSSFAKIGKNSGAMKSWESETFLSLSQNSNFDKKDMIQDRDTFHLIL